MSRPICPICHVPTEDDGRCRSCYEVATGLCASHGYPLRACPMCRAVGQNDYSATRQRRLRALLGIEEAA